MNDDEITDDAFLAARGDRAAAERFVSATRAQLRHVLISLSNPGIADDLMQETYLRAFAALPGYAGRSPARWWLLAIARRVAADHLRVHARRPRVVHVEDWIAERNSVSVPDHGQEVVLGSLFDGLEPLRREAFVLTRVIGLSYRHAAEVCGCEVGTIRSRVSRARADLTAALNVGDAVTPVGS
jgi:RNA polymerase sigma-70 factor (ECF subfamily)